MSKGLYTTVGPSVFKDSWCSDEPKTDTVDDLIDSCECFCGPGNIPVLVGLTSVGFSQHQADDLCLSSNSGDFIHYDKSWMNDCRQAYGALNLIKKRTSSLVQAVNVSRLVQLQFRSHIAAVSRELAEYMSGDDFRREMMAADDDARLAKYQELLDTVLGEFKDQGEARRNLTEAMTAVKSAAEALSAALSQNMPQVDFLVDRCSVMLTVVGSSSEYLLDMCNQRTSNCIESASARHVSCCCGSIPLTGSFEITGEHLDSPASSPGSSPSSSPTAAPVRRLEGKEDEVLDVCGDALMNSKADLTRLEQELAASPDGAALLEAYRTDLDNAYPQYAGRCKSGRMLSEGELQDRRMDQPKDLQQGDNAAASRQLSAPTLFCDPQMATGMNDDVLKVAFWKSTESEYCSELPYSPPPMKDSGLMEICQKFCGESLPVLIGGINFGFNQSAMDEVCIRGSFMRTSEAEVDKCHEDAVAFHAVEEKVAYFMAKLAILEKKKLAFQASVKNGVEDLKESIRERAEGVLKDADDGDKINKLRKFLDQETETMIKTGFDKREVEVAAEAAKQAGSDLETTLSASLASINHLVNDCNHLYTGTGPENEYLLDICSQTSKQCVDVPGGRHSGCCCAYSPLLALGMTSPPTHVIPGKSAAGLDDGEGGARVATSSSARSLSQATTASVVDICAQSWQQSQSEVASVETRVRELGHSDLLDLEKQKFASMYPDLVCPIDEVCYTNTGGTCSMWSCDEGRGPTDCEDSKCICKSGYCLSDGVCTPSSQSQAVAVSSAKPKHVHSDAVLAALAVIMPMSVA
jgi:hypothetical protein